MSEFIEPLEQRQLLSAAPIKASATIAADQAMITEAKAAIIRDQAATRAALVADRAEIPPKRAADLVTIHQAQIKLRQDRGNPTAVETDRAQILLDQAALRTDLQTLQTKIKSDAAAGKVTLDLDRATLRADQIKLRNDRIAGL